MYIWFWGAVFELDDQLLADENYGELIWTEWEDGRFLKRLFDCYGLRLFAFPLSFV